MTISEKDNSLKNQLNLADPNTLPDMFRALGLGDVLRALPTTLRKKAPALNAGVLATLHAVGVAEDGAAHSLFRAYARAGGVTGELTVVAPNTTPASGQIAVAPNGDIVVLAADAITDLDVVYLPEKYDTIELTLPVASNSMALPAWVTARGVAILLEAVATKGTSTGEKIVLAPSAGAAAAGQARLVVAKSSVTFNATDAVTEATVKLAVASEKDVCALLTATSTIA